jgi:beta-mannosidase
VDAREPLELGGGWRAAESDNELQRRFMETGLDDAGWVPVDVPGHWRSHHALAASDGPVLYRRLFDAPRLDAGRRAFVVFDGIFYDGDIWLDETYLGATQGYFAPHEFDVTEALRAGEQHLLAVEVGCSRGGGGGTRRALNGVFADLPGNPGGVWRPVRVVTTGPVHVSRARVLCTEASEQRGRLLVALTLDADLEVAGTGGAPLSARLALRVDDQDGRVLAEQARDVSLADGENHLSVDVDVERPPRWWPRSLGDQPLCRLAIAVELGGEPSDEVSVRTGFREVRARRLRFSVNGEPLFLHGASQGPVRPMLAEADAADFRRVVELALDAGLDLLRVHEHVSRPELYEAADEAGLLLWQDLPMRGRYARTARGQATTQARARPSPEHRDVVRARRAVPGTRARHRVPCPPSARARHTGRVDGAPVMEQGRARPLGRARLAPRRPLAARHPPLRCPARAGRHDDRHPSRRRLARRPARRARADRGALSTIGPLRQRVRRAVGPGGGRADPSGPVAR